MPIVNDRYLLGMTINLLPGPLTCKGYPRPYICLIVLIALAHCSLAIAEDQRSSSEPEEISELYYRPLPMLRLGYNSALGYEFEGGLIFPLRYQTEIGSPRGFGPSLALGYTEAGLKYQIGLAMSQFTQGGGGGHVALEAVYIRPRNSLNSLERGKDYFGVELEAALVGPGGGFGAGVGYLYASEASKENTLYFSLGVGL